MHWCARCELDCDGYQVPARPVTQTCPLCQWPGVYNLATWQQACVKAGQDFQAELRRRQAGQQPEGGSEHV